VIEDNKYGVSVPKRLSTAVERNPNRGIAYGCFGEYVEGNDPDKIYVAAERAVARARAGEGPTILELETERLHGHFIGDPAGYRPEAEREAQRDPIPVYRRRLLDSGVFDEAGLAALEAAVKQRVAASIQFARDSEYPEPAEALDKLYA
jgi:pyruvate dehydrogenase E1 component alpha subunit